MTAVKGKLVNNLRCSSDGGQIMRQLFGECHRELPSVQEGEKNKLSRCEKLLDGFFFFLPSTHDSRNNDLCWPGCLFVCFLFSENNLSRKSLGGKISFRDGRMKSKLASCGVSLRNETWVSPPERCMRKARHHLASDCLHR